MVTIFEVNVFVVTEYSLVRVGRRNNRIPGGHSVEIGSDELVKFLMLGMRAVSRYRTCGSHRWHGGATGDSLSLPPVPGLILRRREVHLVGHGVHYERIKVIGKVIGT